MSDSDLLAEQRAFYRRRAPEYDQWWLRQGRYDHGPEEAIEWQAQVDQVAQALTDFDAGGHVLELAGGTGWWSQRLAATAATLTVVDASPETLILNRARVARADVRYLAADIFACPLRAKFDVVFFSFWLSHVPRPQLGRFWELVSSLLAPAGRVFLIDNRRDPSRTTQDPYVVDEAIDVQRRRLSDGSEHRVVKVFYEPDELQSQLAQKGWCADIEATRWFIYGSTTRSQ